MTKSQFLMRAAVAGIIGASTIGLSSTAAAADDVSAKGHCVGANACKGQGGCKQEGNNECAGKNGCGGKGFLEKTKAECDALAKKNKKIYFQASNK